MPSRVDPYYPEFAGPDYFPRGRTLEARATIHTSGTTVRRGWEAEYLESSDADLVRRARGGDRAAFHQLVERHADGLYRLAMMTLRHAADAQDVVQETLLGAFEGLDRYRGEASVRTWLVRILMNQVARHRRRQGIRRMAMLDETTIAATSAVAASDARMDVAQLLGQLSSEHRDVLVLREIEGLSYEEMAVALSVPRGTVESRLFRARAALRDLALERQMR